MDGKDPHAKNRRALLSWFLSDALLPFDFPFDARSTRNSRQRPPLFPLPHSGWMFAIPIKRRVFCRDKERRPGGHERFPVFFPLTGNSSDATCSDAHNGTEVRAGRDEGLKSGRSPRLVAEQRRRWFEKTAKNRGFRAMKWDRTTVPGLRGGAGSQSTSALWPKTTGP